MADFAKQKAERLAREAKEVKDAESRLKKEKAATWKTNQEKKKGAKPGQEAELEGVGEYEVDPEAEARKDMRAAAMGQGDESLFDKKMTKEEKAAAKAAKKAEREAKKAEKPKKGKGAAEEDEGAGKKSAAEIIADASAEDLDKLSLEDEARAMGIITTFAQGSKALHRNTRDIKVDEVTVAYHGKILVEDTQFALNYGNRYGFLGPNGCGKSTIMKMLAARAIPIPECLDIFFLDHEYAATDKIALECVFEVSEECAKLESEASLLNDAMADSDEEEQGQITDRLTSIYERLEELDSATAEARASSILNGLGFTPAMQQQTTKEFSGGWRMRISLARALFLQPEFLLLDEPTNHLDMDAVIWLEDYLSTWSKILFFVSHSQDFMNNVCTHIVRLDATYKKLRYYAGNYDTYCSTRADQDKVAVKAFEKEQAEIAEIKEFIARFGHGTQKMIKQAQSREKLLEKKLEAGLAVLPEMDQILDFAFPDPGELPTPVLMCQELSFGYPGCKELYSNVEFGIDLGSRVALVGPNGAGKTTLVKLLAGELIPTEGAVRPHSHLRIARFTQHFEDVLDLTKTPIEFFKSVVMPKAELDQVRSWLGRYGCAGSVQSQIMGHLSDGQKARIVFAKMANTKPHLILLDEPTNALDMNAIDSLARAINTFKGGVILVSHDMRLISQVAKELWICDHKKVEQYKGDIMKFKLAMRAQIKGSSGKPAALAQHANG